MKEGKMRFLSTVLKLSVPMVGVFCLTATQAAAHADVNNLLGHAFFNFGHCMGFVIMGIIAATFVLIKNKVFSIIGNFVLCSFLIYQSFVHFSAIGLSGAAVFFFTASLIILVSCYTTCSSVQFFIGAVNNIKPFIHDHLSRLNTKAGFPEVKAHCDIPCKIYDPAIALISTLSVIRLIDIIKETQSSADKTSESYQNTMARSIQRKEEECENLKREIRVIWGDYFKEPQFNSHPEIHDLTHQIMLLASAAKQNVNREDALKLLECVNQFAEIFWVTKEVDTERKVAPYPPSLEVVRPK